MKRTIRVTLTIDCKKKDFEDVVQEGLNRVYEDITTNTKAWDPSSGGGGRVTYHYGH